MNTEAASVETKNAETKNAEAKTVLLVDDAPANIQIVNSILKGTYKIQIATSGEKALKIANQSPPPDLILLDVMMPEMDGYEVCSRLKSAANTRDIPVIFLTGQTETDDETRGFEVNWSTIELTWAWSSPSGSSCAASSSRTTSTGCPT